MLTFRQFWGLTGLLMAAVSILIWWHKCLPRVQSNIAGSTNFPLSNSSLTKRSNFSAKCLLAHQTNAITISTIAIVMRPSQKGSSSIRCESGLYGRCSQRVSHRGPKISNRNSINARFIVEFKVWFFLNNFLLQASFLLHSNDKCMGGNLKKYLKRNKNVQCVGEVVSMSNIYNDNSGMK